MIFALAFAGIAIGVSLGTGFSRAGVVIGIGFLLIGLLGIAFSFGLTIRADKVTRTLTLSERSFLRRKERHIPFDALVSVDVESRGYGDDSIPALFLVGRAEDGSILFEHGTGWLAKAQETAARLREFIGLPESESADSPDR